MSPALRHLIGEEQLDVATASRTEHRATVASPQSSTRLVTVLVEIKYFLHLDVLQGTKYFSISYCLEQDKGCA